MEDGGNHDLVDEPPADGRLGWWCDNPCDARTWGNSSGFHVDRCLAAGVIPRVSCRGRRTAGGFRVRGLVDGFGAVVAFWGVRVRVFGCLVRRWWVWVAYFLVAVWWCRVLVCGFCAGVMGVSWVFFGVWGCLGVLVGVFWAVGPGFLGGGGGGFACG